MRARIDSLVALATILSCGIAAAQGPRLEFIERLADPLGAYNLGGAHAVTISPDGRHVYTASFDDNAVVVLSRNVVTGAVSFLQAKLDQEGEVRGLFRPVSIVVAPDGAHVYVGAFFGDAVATFARDPLTGELRFVDALFGGAAGQRGLTQVHGMAFVPDGSQLVVVSYGDNAITVLTRDRHSGRLAVTQVLSDRGDSGEVEGLVRPTAVAVSPTGTDVFVVSSGSASLVHLRRTAETGHLIPLASFLDGVSGVGGLAGVVAVSVSPDGRDIYTLGTEAVGHFRQDPDGNLQFVGTLTDPEVIGGGDSAGPTALALAPQGSAMLVTRGGDDTVVLLERDLQSGDLQIVDAVRDGENGVDGLAGAADASFDPAGRFAYVASQFDDSVATFRRWPRCEGDCNEDGEVTVEELVLGVAALLTEAQPLGCWQMDRSGDGRLTVDEIVRGVRHALGGCS
ncbi:MAG: lactonase family protein [Candidatus Binatia bacterium]|nr:lactonase family protein [Candidatus Binatia bacterium]